MNHGDFLGFVALDGTLYGYVLTLNSSGTPTDADSQPTYTIFGPSGAVTNGTGTSASVTAEAGLYSFSHSIASGDGYTSGTSYTVYAEWEESSTAKAQTFTFTVV